MQGISPPLPPSEGAYFVITTTNYTSRVPCKASAYADTPRRCQYMLLPGDDLAIRQHVLNYNPAVLYHSNYPTLHMKLERQSQCPC